MDGSLSTQPLHPDHIVLYRSKHVTTPDEELILTHLRYGDPNVMENHCRVWMSDDVPIAIAGVNIVWPGYGVVYLFASTEAKMNPKSLVQWVRGRIQELEDRLELRRVEMTCPINHMLIKWGNLLGFEVEGILRKYSPSGEDHVVMSRVSE